MLADGLPYWQGHNYYHGGHQNLVKLKLVEAGICSWDK
jgi:hypothetical protein